MDRLTAIVALLLSALAYFDPFAGESGRRPAPGVAERGPDPMPRDPSFPIVREEPPATSAATATVPTIGKVAVFATLLALAIALIALSVWHQRPAPAAVDRSTIDIVLRRGSELPLRGVELVGDRQPSIHHDERGIFPVPREKSGQRLLVLNTTDASRPIIGLVAVPKACDGVAVVQLEEVA